MIAYLLFGTGVLLVFGAVFYTYRVDQRVKGSVNMPVPDPGLRQTAPAMQEIPPLTQTAATRPAASYAQVMKQAQVKESISGIGEDLDELIDELREKEAEVKEFLQQVKGWKTDLAAGLTGGVAVSLEGAVQANTPHPTPEPDLPEQPDEETGMQDPEPVVGDADIRYQKMLLLLDQGISPDEVARTLGMGQREVELVYKMRQKGA